jgi:hypothetical protein
MNSSGKIIRYLCTPLSAGIRCNTVALQSKRTGLKISVPGSYIFLEQEDVESLKGVISDVEYRKDKGWILRSPMAKEELSELLSGGDGTEDMDEDEKVELLREAGPCSWLEDPADDETRKLSFLEEKEIEDALTVFFGKFSNYGHPFEFTMDLNDALDSLTEKHPDGFWWPWEAQGESISPDKDVAAQQVRDSNAKRDAALEALVRRALERADAPVIEVSVSAYSGDPDGWGLYVKAGEFKLTPEKREDFSRRYPRHAELLAAESNQPSPEPKTEPHTG